MKLTFTTLSAALGMGLLAAPAGAAAIDLNDFFADPTVTVAADGSMATIAEDPGFSPIILANDPGLGDPNVIIPAAGAILSFDYMFTEAAGGDDEFGYFLIDGTTGLDIAGYSNFIVDSMSGTESFNLSSLTGMTLGLSFQLSGLPGDTDFNSTVKISNLRIDVVPLPASALLLGAGIASLMAGRRRRS